jgi:hypothetical protein
MSIYTPYFYVIQDTRNGMYYAGAKWHRKANPNTFMKKNGYTTSSNIINGIIAKCGIDAFVIRKIRIFKDKDSAQNYETRFLRKINARHNLNFYNTHNNDGIMDNEKMKLLMNGLYGVDHHFKSSKVKEKMKNTWIEKYGVDNPRKSEFIQNKSRQSCLEKYGCENYNNRDQAKETLKNKYGVINVSQLDNIKEIKRIKRSTKLNRPIVLEIKEYQKKYNLKFGKSWNVKSDEYLSALLEEIKNKYDKTN